MTRPPERRDADEPGAEADAGAAQQSKLHAVLKALLGLGAPGHHVHITPRLVLNVGILQWPDRLGPGGYRSKSFSPVPLETDLDQWVDDLYRKHCRQPRDPRPKGRSDD